MSERAVKRGVLWLLLGNLTYAACQWGSVIVLARVSGPTAVGKYALALAVAAPIWLLCNLSLRQILATDARCQWSWRVYARLRDASVAIGIGLMGLVTVIAGYDRGMIALILAVAAAKGIESLSDLRYGLFQAIDEMRAVGLSLAARGILGLAAMIAALLLTRDVAWAVLGLAGAWLVVLVVMDMPRARRSILCREEQPLDSKLGGLLRSALPMGVAAMLASLNPNLPRYMVESRIGIAELGYFAALSHLVFAGNLAITATGQALSPRLARYAAQGARREFNLLLRRFLIVAGAFGVACLGVVLLAGRPLLGFFYGESFARHAGLLNWLFVVGAVGFCASVLDYGMIAQRRFKTIPLVQVCVVSANAIACVVLIPRYGLLGAALSWLVAVSVQSVVQGIICFGTGPRGAGAGSGGGNGVA
jgi:O-antigen/teichoic acid export membrane protein